MAGVSAATAALIAPVGIATDRCGTASAGRSASLIGPDCSRCRRMSVYSICCTCVRRSRRRPCRMTIMIHGPIMMAIMIIIVKSVIPSNIASPMERDVSVCHQPVSRRSVGRQSSRPFPVPRVCLQRLHRPPVHGHKPFRDPATYGPRSGRPSRSPLPLAQAA